eukprot:Nk52_evm4s288 gene=Nk52_evmTU4s288
MSFLARFESKLSPGMKKFWNHEAGPQTIFFWAPAAKWCLVIAGIADLQRPADKLSVTQSGALAATGIIWSRYSLVIIPKNWSLFAVNIFVGATGIMQTSRALKYQWDMKSQAKEKGASASS